MPEINLLSDIGNGLSLWGLFISSFLAATLLPGGSEVVLLGVLKLYPELFWPALLLGTLGNTLGGMVTFGMGGLLPATQQLKHVEQVRRHGAPVLLLAWLPLAGDALCLAAGWLRPRACPWIICRCDRADLRCSPRSKTRRCVIHNKRLATPECAQIGLSLRVAVKNGVCGVARLANGITIGCTLCLAFIRF